MKVQFLTLLALIATIANAADTTSSSTIKPTAVLPAPPGVVCAMVVCGSATSSLAKRQASSTPACPVICPNDCKIIDDVCCPGQKKAVCSTNSTSTSGSGSVPVATATSTSMIMPTPSVSAAANASGSTATAPSASAASPPAKSDANLHTAASILSTCMLVTLMAVGLNQL